AWRSSPAKARSAAARVPVLMPREAIRPRAGGPHRSAAWDPSPRMDVSVIERLCAVGGRGACTDAERRAARDLHDRLRERGAQAWVETRWIRPQRRASLVLHALLAVVGG